MHLSSNAFYTCFFYFVFIGSILVTGCRSSKENCAKFYTYKSKSLNLKALTINLKRRGFDMGNVALGNISVDPAHVVASELLQRLDLLQYEICKQIRSQKNDSAKSMAKLRYINTLIDMVNIGRHPDSLLGSKIAVLEKKRD